MFQANIFFFFIKSSPNLNRCAKIFHASLMHVIEIEAAAIEELQ